MQQKLSKTPAKNLQKPSKNTAKTQQNARFLDVFTHARARQCMVQKIGRGGNEGGEGKEEKEEEEEEEKEEDEEEDEEEDKEDKEDEEDEEDEPEEEDEAKRREEGRGRGGGSLSKISSEETLSKLRLKLNQNKAKSTKHAGKPADFNLIYIYICNTYIQVHLKSVHEFHGHFIVWPSKHAILLPGAAKWWTARATAQLAGGSPAAPKGDDPAARGRGTKVGGRGSQRKSGGKLGSWTFEGETKSSGDDFVGEMWEDWAVLSTSEQLKDANEWEWVDHLVIII